MNASTSYTHRSFAESVERSPNPSKSPRKPTPKWAFCVGSLPVSRIPEAPVAPNGTLWHLSGAPRNYCIIIIFYATTVIGFGFTIQFYLPWFPPCHPGFQPWYLLVDHKRSRLQVRA